MQAAPSEPRPAVSDAASHSVPPERFIIEFWPSIAWLLPGRLLGALFLAVPRWGLVHVLTLRNLVLLLLAPISALVYLLARGPFVVRRYRLTNRRVSIIQGVQRVEISSLAHGEYDAIDLEVGWGQAWYLAADLVFRRDGREVFRLAACGYPDSVRSTIWKAHQAWVWLHQGEQA
ncbi:MAG TPA: hypothetical protein VGE52_10485 [Pirellulales bacterium]